MAVSLALGLTASLLDKVSEDEQAVHNSIKQNHQVTQGKVSHASDRHPRVGMSEDDLRILGLDFRIRGPLTKFDVGDIEMQLFVVDLTGRDVNNSYIGL